MNNLNHVLKSVGFINFTITFYEIHKAMLATEANLIVKCKQTSSVSGKTLDNIF